MTRYSDCLTYISHQSFLFKGNVLGIKIHFSLGVIFASVLIFALVRGVLRYAEQACNHFIAFKLLALIRDKVFAALRKLCPAKLEGRDKGDLISVITSDIELLEVFYAHTISPVIIAFFVSLIMCVFLAHINPVLAVVVLANLGSTLQNTFAAGNRVLDILDEQPVTKDVTGCEKVEFKGADAENVTFSYGEETILSDVSVPVPKGSIIGISGRSGSGKSTLLKLFMRFWSTDKGSIKISDKSVENINTDNLRSMEKLCNAGYTFI